MTSNRRELTYTTLGGSLWEGEGNGNYQNATIPVTIPGSIPRNYGMSHPWFLLTEVMFKTKSFEKLRCSPAT